MPLSEYDELMYLDLSNPVPYELEYYDRQSLKEIKEMALNHEYTDASTISEHLLFLEHLADKLQQILHNEESAGESAMVLRENLKEIKNLYNTLNFILNGINQAS